MGNFCEGGLKKGHQNSGPGVYPGTPATHEFSGCRATIGYVNRAEERV